MMHLLTFTLASSSTLSLATRGPKVSRSAVKTVPRGVYEQDCFRKARKHVSLLSEDSRPGVGMTPDEYTPYATVLKDGFFEVDCAKDLLFHEGDKHGDGKFSYALGDVSNVSIVHYSEMTPKEDREEMTHEVCFRFCRTIPDMHFFGIVNGRDCYCTPYFKPVAGDSSDCDAVCPGKPTEFCGGKYKSSLFEMHDCKDTLANLADAVAKAGEAKESLDKAEKVVADLGAAEQNSGVFWQDVSGKLGMPSPAQLMQEAKVWAGELEHAAEAARDLASKLGDTAKNGQEALDANAANPSDFKVAKEMEDITHNAEDLTEKANRETEHLEEMAQLASPVHEGTANASKQYYPLTYFVDKKIDSLMSVCGGKTVKKPIVDVTLDGCARACDADVHDCVGFSFMNMQNLKSMCFLFAKFVDVTYVIDCPAMFLQTKRSAKTDDEIQCYGKLSEFPSSIAPDASGKCDGCLKKATKRCKA